jgi:uncharacterized phage infection (PIP) family protein YhgE
MLTKDDLDLIRGVIREEVEAEAKTTRQEITVRYVKLITEVNKVADRVKDVEITGTRLEKGQQAIQGDVKSLQEGQTSLIERQTTSELKMETFHAYQKQAHEETTKLLLNIIEIDGQEQNTIKKRVDRIEKHLDLPLVK